MQTRTWLVAIDRSARCVGALQFSTWLHARTHALGHRFVGVHVLEPPRLALERRLDHAAVEREIRAFVARVGASAAMSEIVILEGRRASDRLADRAHDEHAGLVVGRVAGVSGWSLSALGGTTRRLLRHLPGPVCVVPPDLDVSRLDPGPVVVAVVDDDTSVPAVREATAIARQLGRAVVGISAVGPLEPVAPMPEAAVGYAPFPTTEEDMERLEQATAERLEQWLSANHLDAPALRIRHGGPADAVARGADHEHACMIVCGSRELSPVRRIFSSSVGTDLAAHATLPILVVPAQ